jgi:predicted permease
MALAAALAARGSGAGDGMRFGIGRVIVVLQVGLALVVMVVAGLLVRSLVGLRSQPLGFDRDHLLLAWTQPSSTGRQGTELTRLWHDVQDRLSALPGVVSVSASNGGLLNGVVLTAGRPTPRMRVENQPVRLTTLAGGRTFIMPGFFKSLGVPVLRGREFTNRDTELTSPPVVILNETMARFYFGDEDPIGRHVGFGPQAVTPVEVVGVVSNFERGSPRAVGQGLMLPYFPVRSDASPQMVVMCVVIRVQGDPRTLVPQVRAELRRIDSSLAVLKINTIDDQLDDVIAQDRVLAGLGTFFGGLSGLLACLGLYGLMAQITSQRTAEIGVRVALGATPGSVLAMVLRDGLILVALGLLVGGPAALASARLVQGRLFGVSTHDPIAIVAAMALMIAVAGAGAMVPARRAANLDPVAALRAE